MIDQSNEAAVRARAYELWEMSDQSPGQHEEHWRQAERELDGDVQTENVTKISSQHDDGVSELPAQDDNPPILHHVPEPAPGQATEHGAGRR